MRRITVILTALVVVLAAAGAGATPASAAGPTAIGVDNNGVVYVGFANGGQIKRYAGADGTALAPWGVPGSGAGQLGAVVAIDVAPGGSGNVWILDSNRRVQEFDRAGNFIRGIQLGACSGAITPSPTQRGGLDVSNTDVYVAHPCADSILRLQRSNLQTMATASFTQPKGVSTQLYNTAPANTVATYVARPAANLVQILNPSHFGQMGTKSSPAPTDLFVDAFGVLFATDTASDKIHLYGSDGNEFRTLGSPGSAAGQLNDPMAIDVFEQFSDLSGNVFIADYGNNRIQRWNPFGFTFWTAAADDAGAGPAAPVNTAPPTISGTAVQGQTLTCNPGTWTNSPTFAYQWLRNGVAIGGATSSSYTIVAADVGQQLVCRVTASNAGGSAQANSAAVVPAASAAAPVNQTPPAISGTTTQGSTLTCSQGTWTGNPAPTFAYSWQRNGVPIGGATASTYTIVAADVGQAVRCAVTATNASGSTTAFSTAVTPTAGACTSGTTGVSINNGAAFTNSPGVTLTIHEPANATAVVISNDGGFASPTQVPVACTDSYSRTLTSTGAERLPKTVYVRFIGAGIDADKTFTDDIVLDEVAAAVQSASLRSASVASGSSSQKKGYVLSVRARDSNSGVAKIQTASSKNATRQTTYRYRSTLRLRGSKASARYVRAIDRAGNVGKWKKVKVVKALSH